MATLLGLAVPNFYSHIMLNYVNKEESAEHVLLRYTAYRSEREQLWELMEAGCGLGEGWGWLEEEQKVKVLLGQDMCMEGGGRIDRKRLLYIHTMAYSRLTLIQ